MLNGRRTRLGVQSSSLQAQLCGWLRSGALSSLGDCGTLRQVVPLRNLMGRLEPRVRWSVGQSLAQDSSSLRFLDFQILFAVDR